MHAITRHGRSAKWAAALRAAANFARWGCRVFARYSGVVIVTRIVKQFVSQQDDFLLILLTAAHFREYFAISVNN